MERGYLHGETNDTINLVDLMLDETAHKLMVANSSEAKYLTWALLNGHDEIDGITLYEEFDVIYDLAQKGAPLPFSSSYFSEICKQGTKLGIVEQAKGTKDHTVRHSYKPNDLLERLALPVAGHIAQWQLQYGINLREFLREPRSLKDGEVSGTLIRIGLMGLLLNGPLPEQQIREFLNPIAKSRDIRSQKSRWVKQLADHPFVVFKDGFFRLNDEAVEPIYEFIVLLEKARNLDRDFYAEGELLAAEIFNDDASIANLLLRTQESSNKISGKIVDYQRLGSRIENVVRGNSTPLTLADLPSMFPDLNQYQLYKLRRDLKSGRLSPLLKVTHPNPTDVLKLKDQVIVPKHPQVALAYLALKACK
jgi:hypothetical protein